MSMEDAARDAGMGLNEYIQRCEQQHDNEDAGIDRTPCPACARSWGVSGDFDPDCGFFYKCEACGHRWGYQGDNVPA